MALQLRIAKTDISGSCQVVVHGALWLANRYPSTSIPVFLTGFRYFSFQVITQLFSRCWVDPIPYPILPEKLTWYSRDSNPGPLEWQSYMLNTTPQRWFETSLFCDLYIRFITQILTLLINYEFKSHSPFLWCRPTPRWVNDPHIAYREMSCLLQSGKDKKSYLRI